MNQETEPIQILVDRQTNFKNRADKHLFEKPSSWQRISIDIKVKTTKYT